MDILEEKKRRRGESATTKGGRQNGRERRSRRERGESIAAAIPCKGVMIHLGSGLHGNRLRGSYQLLAGACLARGEP